jgi:hypothetical protein
VGVDGYGELNVDNGTSEDAEVIVYDIARDEKTRDFNVKARSLLRIPGITAGTYELKYAQGTSCYQFERTLDYTEQRDGGTVNYDEISVTLHPVAGGTARTKKISPADFLRGHPPSHPLKTNTGSN